MMDLLPAVFEWPITSYLVCCNTVLATYVYASSLAPTPSLIPTCPTHRLNVRNSLKGIEHSGDQVS